MTIDITQDNYDNYTQDTPSTTPKTFTQKLVNSTDSIVLCMFVASLFGLNAMTAFHPSTLHESFQCFPPDESHYCPPRYTEILSLLWMNIIFTILLVIPFGIAIGQQWQYVSLLHPYHHLSKIIFDINHMLFGYCILCWFTNNWMIFFRIHGIDSSPILRVLLRYTIIQDIYMFLYILFFNLYHYRQQVLYQQQQQNQNDEDVDQRTLDPVYHETESVEREPSIIETISFVLILLLIPTFIYHATWHFRI